MSDKNYEREKKEKINIKIRYFMTNAHTSLKSKALLSKRKYNVWLSP